MPSDDPMSMWVAQANKRIDDHSNSTDKRFEALEKRVDEHLGQPGHVGQEQRYADILSRLGRLELGVASTLIAVVLMLAKTFLGGG